jgi:hydrophobic/amphiphilic exporter-1 (mainly G- bacteria), HAE1 family
MWHLTQLAIRNRLVTLVIVILIAAASIWAIFGLKLELIPNIQFPYTTVITVYPQAPPDQVLSNVTKPIENVIWSQWEGKGLKHLTSTSADSISIIFGEFEFGTDMNKVTSTIHQGISQLTLPPEVLAFPQMNPAIGENPRIIPINMSLMPLVVLSLSGDLPPDQLKQVADTQIVPALQSVKGVLNVETEGGDKEQVVIAPDPAKMNEYGISMSQIVGLLAPQYTSLSQIENTSMGADGVVLGDIAEVGQGAAPGTIVTRTNGQPSITITVMKKADANTVDVANAVLAKAKEASVNLGNGVKLDTTFTQSDFIQRSINDLRDKALIGAALAIVIVFLFLTAIRASLVTAISIPLSLLIGFLAMRAFGLTINLLTLSAMSIAVGRLIDDSIVMVEVIYRRLQRGEGFREAAVGGAKEIANPITSATLATVAIFIPLIFVGGIVGQLFIPFALTVTFAMLASLLVALMVVPTLSNFLVSGKAKVKVSVPWYQKLYTPALKWALGHRALTLIIAAVLFFGSLGLVQVIGTSFMSGMGEKTLTVAIQMKPGTDPGKTSDIATQLEAKLAGNKEVKKYYTTVGTSTSLMGAMSTARGGGDNTATITVYLDPGADIYKEAEALGNATKEIATAANAGIAITASESGSGPGGGFSDLNISIQGQNQNDIANTTGQLFAQLQGVKGLANLQSDLTMVVPKLDVELDQAKVAALGLPPAQLLQLQQEFYLLMMGSTLPGNVADIGNESYPIFVKGVASGLGNVTEADSLRIGWPQAITLDKVADVTLTDVPTHIGRTDLALSATITGEITEKDVGGVNRLVQEKIDALPSHPGVELKMAGAAEEMASTFSRMGIAIIAAIVIAFLIVAFMMRSIINPLIIMVSLPLASIGALLGLLITGHTIGVSAMMGMLMLVGIVLTNAIVLMALVEQLRKSGMSTYDALIQGGQTRLRPILMTALTTIFAMIPLALGVGSGTLLAAELAVVVIGGLFSSTLLTLVVIPVIYSLVDGLRRRRARTG